MTEKILGTVIVYGEDTPQGHYPVTNIFDIDGEETDDINQACRAVVKIKEDKWVIFDIDLTWIYPLV